MIRNYFIVALRNIFRNKGYAAINILGLAAGMTVAILIGIWITDELSFNEYFENHDRIAQVMLVQETKEVKYVGPTIASPVEDPLRNKYGAHFKALSLCSYPNSTIISYKDKKLSRSGRWVQPDFPVMFTLKMVAGSRDALKDASGILISSAVAEELFGTESPIDKTVRLDNKLDLIVRGVYEELPRNTSFFDTGLLMPWQNKENWNNTVTNWDNHSCLLFAQLQDGVDVDELAQTIKNLPTPHIQDVHEEIALIPFKDLYLYGSEFVNGEARDAHIQIVLLFGGIATFVLVLACINFMNLSTARSQKRAKEIGIRKTMGSIRLELIGQFLMESIVVTVIAFALSLVISQLVLPLFNELSGKDTAIPLGNPVFWILSVLFVLVTGIFSGSYPAFFLSSFQPIKVLKGIFPVGRTSQLPRKVLVVFQFTVSITLIVCTIVVFNQIEFAKNRMSGFSRDGLVTIRVNTPELTRHFDVIRNELMQSGAVLQVARASQTPAHFDNNNGVEWPGKDPGLVVYFRNVSVSPEFGKTVGWKILDGRDFHADQVDSGAVLFNEAAIKVMGLKEPLGETVTFDGKSYTIVGIVQDMLTQSPYEPVPPAIFLPDGWLGVIVLRLNTGLPTADALAKVEHVFRKHNPSAPFDFSFVDQEFNRKFADEQRLGKVAAFFTVLAIFISCLGLFGLASFVSAQRTKEIGIRKILGASALALCQMLSKDFVLLILAACAVAIPLSFLLMTAWLQNYAYRTTVTWELMISSAMGALLITLITISYQTIQAMWSNPIDSLRSE